MIKKGRRRLIAGITALIMLTVSAVGAEATSDTRKQLDDANANLFAEFLSRFSVQTQFIVITHRKPTMRHADTIFGVTMEERGVTKIVSISFEEAEKHASDNR